MSLPPRLARLYGRRWFGAGVLGVSVLAHVLVSALGAGPFALIDLQVYLDASRHFSDGALYTMLSGTQELPFTYPPFAAMIFVPLGLLPRALVVVLWEVASIAAIAGIAHLTLRLAGRTGRRATRPLSRPGTVVLVTTALGIWLDPVRGTLNYGQVNLFLALALLAGAVTAREVLAGASVGLTAGVKLVPAITGLYYLATRRWRAAVWSAAFFAATIAVSAVLLPSSTRLYFTHLIVDPGRTGDIWHTRNQSLRGALYRLLGHDSIPLWLGCAAICLALGTAATVLAARRGDRLAAFLAAQFTGLLISPVSWWHHWVWVLPLLLWCVFGAARTDRRVLVLGWCWAVVGFTFVASLLISWQNSHLASGASRGLPEALADTVYVVLGIATLVVIAFVHRPGGGFRARRDRDTMAATRESGAPG